VRSGCGVCDDCGGGCAVSSLQAGSQPLGEFCPEQADRPRTGGPVPVPVSSWEVGGGGRRTDPSLRELWMLKADVQFAFLPSWKDPVDPLDSWRNRSHLGC
jgi:hypothetical protein